MNAGDLVRQARERHGVSQAALALRMGTTQTAISRTERGHRSPSVETLRQLLLALGEDLVIGSRPLRSGVDPDHLRATRALTMSQRVERGFGWTRLRASLQGGARRARSKRRSR